MSFLQGQLAHLHDEGAPKKAIRFKHAFHASEEGGRFCGRCYLSAINPIHRHEPDANRYKHGGSRYRGGAR